MLGPYEGPPIAYVILKPKHNPIQASNPVTLNPHSTVTQILQRELVIPIKCFEPCGLGLRVQDVK